MKTPPQTLDAFKLREINQKVIGFGKLTADDAIAVFGFLKELETYREGGVTEEILRRNDGYIKVGKGCAIVRADEIKP